MSVGLLNREWTDAEKWISGLVSAALIAAGAAIWGSLSGDVVADIASKRDRHGRCVDAEVSIRNDTKSDALDIEVAFDVDYFTRQGAVALEFGDEQDQLIPPGERTLLPRLPYVRIPASMDQTHSILRVPRLKPGQYIHLFHGGEPRLDSGMADARDKMLAAGDKSLMDKPRVSTVTRKDGSVVVRRVIECPTK
jgi:hypothetical protein